MLPRRTLIKRSASALGMAWLGYEGLGEFALGRADRDLAIGFHNDAPSRLDAYSRPAAHWQARAGTVHCELCPHLCVLGEDDRGFCRTRVVKNGALHTIAYGNLCSLAVDPIEKKPLYHFLPETPILSLAIGGCNFRCRNCQNWEISQARPEDVKRFEAMPERLVTMAVQRDVPSIAYTYSEPLVYYEYVRDTAALARARGIRNVLVTAGYVNEAPLRELCRVVDAVTLDVKAFRDSFYREVSGGRRDPVLRALEVMREEGVWLEVSFLMVPTLSDDAAELGEFARWVAKRLGQDTPLHVLRFHPAHRLAHLPPTPISALQQAGERARGEGLHHVYLGNVPGPGAGRTVCPNDGEVLVERQGFRVVTNRLAHGACPRCGRRVAGVFEA
jgi:pyruvate formate lyase activating enzyme